LLGERWSLPVGIAPIGYLDALWPGAETALAAAAAQADIPFVLSTYAVTDLETMAGVNPQAWFQLYAFRDEATTLDLVRRARAAGYKVLVVTVDVPVYSKRCRDLRNGLELPPRITPRILAQVARAPIWLVGTVRRGRPLVGSLMAYAPAGMSGWRAAAELMRTEPNFPVTWRFIERIRAAWPDRLLVKGLLDPEDARTAAAIGADGIVVSNHGGRQLDAAPASIDALPAVVEAVGDRIAVMLDGGVRCGLDVVKALVRGAHFVFAGRPFVLAMAAAGARGGAYAVSLFHAEIVNAMGQLGLTSIAKVRGNRALEFEPARRDAAVSRGPAHD
jgi:isopentenyl diphosphate isomerase/L-lactate dehydrogenase-like FMN-dependent dehydrogenase